MKKSFIFDNEGVMVESSWKSVAEAVRELGGMCAEGKAVKQLLKQPYGYGELEEILKLDHHKADETLYGLPIGTDVQPYGDRIEQLIRDVIAHPKKPARPNKSRSPLDDYSIGGISSERFYSAAAERLGVEATLEAKKSLANAMANLTGHVNQEAVDIVKELKQQGHQVLMLSNTNMEIFRGNISRHDYFGYFDKIYFSCFMDVRKPDKEAWLNVLEDFDLNPADCVFIDDTEANIKVAQEIGLNTVKYRIGDRQSLRSKLHDYLKTGIKGP